MFVRKTIRKKISTRVTYGALIALFVLVLSNTNPTAVASSAEPTQLVLPNTEGPMKHFMQNIGGGPQQYPCMMMFEPLVQVDQMTGEILPCLADDWDISEDGLVYTFYLQPDALWHDGEPVTAEDVEYTFNYLISHMYTGAGFLKGVDTIEIVDQKTVKITLTQPDASFLIKVNGRYSGAMDIYPKHYLDVGVEWEDNDEAKWNPIGSGPYKFKEYIEGAEVRLEAFPDWWGGKPGFDKVVHKLIPDVTLAGAAFEAGEIDFLNQFTSFAEYKRMAAKEGVESGIRFSYMEALEFNVNKAPFSDVNVRKAIAYAINRTELNEKIYLGLGEVPENPFFPSWMGWSVNPDVKALPYDPEMAKTLLDDAGYKPDAQGVRFSMRLTYARPYHPPPTFIDVLIKDLKEVGIEARHDPYEWALWHSNVYEEAGPWDPEKHDFDVSVHHVIVVWDPEIGVADEVTQGRLYYFGYENAEVNDNFAQGRAKVAHEERAPFYYKIQEIYAEDIPYYVLVNPPTATLFIEGLKNVLVGDANRFSYSYWEMETTTSTTTPAVSEPAVITMFIGALVITTFALMPYLRNRKNT